ncbi:MAG TPA: kelch repeat-containing protein, partial [Planctomycetota bacterium]|nr:kelch repeat-containing protein [Planctomycetota bacterium]
TPPTTTTTYASVVSADLEPSSGNLLPAQGDQLTITFSQNVTVGSSDPTGQLALLIPTDSFGAGAAMYQGSSPNQVVVVLGSNPVIRISGTYDPTNPSPNAPSGIDIDPNVSAIYDAKGNPPVAGNGTDISSQSFSEGCFYSGASLNTSRGLHSATLMGDGRVLIAGGVYAAGAGNSSYVLENEIFDPVANTFTNVSDPSLGSSQPYMVHTDQAGVAFVIGRMAQATVQLSDGTVLIAGGHGYEDRDASSNPVYGELTSCFIFDPTTNAFTETGALNTARRDGQAVLFTNGMVMVYGGRDANGNSLATSEIWDPSSGTWSQGPQMVQDRYEFVSVVFSGGLLVCGGTSTGIGTVTQDELYVSGFGPTGSLNQPRTGACGSMLGSGDVLVAGGNDDTGVPLDSIEVYSASTNTFSYAGSLQSARYRAVSKRIWDDVVVIGGESVDSGGNVTTVDTVETVNAAGSIATFPLNTSRMSHTATHLADGRVLIVGGFSAPTTDVYGMDGYSNYTAEVYVRP